MVLVKRRNAMFDFEKLSASKFYVAPTSERVVEFSPSDVDMTNVAKVLSVAVDARATSVEAQDGYAQVGGRVNFRLAYLSKDACRKAWITMQISPQEWTVCLSRATTFGRTSLYPNPTLTQAIRSRLRRCSKLRFRQSNEMKSRR